MVLKNVIKMIESYVENKVLGSVIDADGVSAEVLF